MIENWKMKTFYSCYEGRPPSVTPGRDLPQ